MNVASPRPKPNPPTTVGEEEEYWGDKQKTVQNKTFPGSFSHLVKKQKERGQGKDLNPRLLSGRTVELKKGLGSLTREGA